MWFAAFDFRSSMYRRSESTHNVSSWNSLVDCARSNHLIPQHSLFSWNRTNWSPDSHGHSTSFDGSKRAGLSLGYCTSDAWSTSINGSECCEYTFCPILCQPVLIQSTFFQSQYKFVCECIVAAYNKSFDEEETKSSHSAAGMSEWCKRNKSLA